MSENAPKYGHLWQLTGEGGPPLPLLPAFTRNIYGDRDVQRWSNIYTAAVAEVGGQLFALSGGVNVAYIPDFCGGCMFSCVNYRVMPLRTGWMDEDSKAQLNSAPRVHDFLGDGWYDKLAVYDGGGPLWRRMYDDDNVVYTRLRKLVVASVFAKLMLRASTYNQHVMSFWDRRDGATRAAVKWASGVFRKGLYAKGNYARPVIPTTARWGAMNRNGGYDLSADSWGNDALLDVRVYPYAYVAGRSRRNHNSGASVSNGQLLCDRVRNKNNPARGATRITFVANSEWNRIACGLHVTSLLRVPSMWHTM